MDTLARNTANVKAFYDLMFNQCRPAEAIAKYAIPETSANDNSMF